MSEAKHTPGPWAVPLGQQDQRLIAVYSPYEHCVAVAYGTINGAVQANARLIAAAPDLLAALEACELAMDTAALSGVGDILAPAYRESWAQAHMKARELLKQLKGS